MFLAKAHYDITLLEVELLHLYERKEDKQSVSLFLNWLRQLALYDKISPEDYGQLDDVTQAMLALNHQMPSIS